MHVHNIGSQLVMEEMQLSVEQQDLYGRINDSLEYQEISAYCASHNVWQENDIYTM